VPSAIGSGSASVGTYSSDFVRLFNRYRRAAVACVMAGKTLESFSAISAGEWARDFFA